MLTLLIKAMKAGRFNDAEIFINRMKPEDFSAVSEEGNPLYVASQLGRMEALKLIGVIPPQSLITILKSDNYNPEMLSILSKALFIYKSDVAFRNQPECYFRQANILYAINNNKEEAITLYTKASMLDARYLDKINSNLTHVAPSEGKDKPRPDESAAEHKELPKKQIAFTKDLPDYLPEEEPGSSDNYNVSGEVQAPQSLDGDSS